MMFAGTPCSMHSARSSAVGWLVTQHGSTPPVKPPPGWAYSSLRFGARIARFRPPRTRTQSVICQSSTPFQVVTVSMVV